MELLPNNLNYTEYVLKSDYSYYTDSNSETENTTVKNCTQDMQNCTKQAFADEEQSVDQTNIEAEGEGEGVTETIDGGDNSKPKTITLLDFSNYLIPSQEINEDAD